MKKIVIGLLVVGLLATSSLAAWGDKGKKMKMGMKEKNRTVEQGMKKKTSWGKLGPMFSKKLGLTVDQQKEFLAKKKDLEKQAVDNKYKNKELQLKIKEELAKDNPDKNKVKNLIQGSGKNMTEMRIKRMELMLDLRSKLTPAQKAKFKEMMKNRKPLDRARDK